ncbi:MAG: AEC family transporter [Rhodospirillales bacterium]
MAAEILSIIAPVFLIATIGYLWAWRKMSFDTGMVTQLTVLITTPCLVIDTFLRAQLSLDAFADMVVATLALYAAMAAVSFLVLKALGWSVQHFLPSLIFGNTGNMGLPLCLFAFGEPGLALAITIFSVAAVLNFSLGVSIASGSMSPKQMLRMPILYAVAIAVAIVATGVRPPVWLGETLALLGGVSIPLLILALGVSLARLTVGNLGRALALSCLRIGVGAGLGFAVAWAFELEGIARGVLILQSAMPAAVFNYLFAERYSTAGPQVAGVVLASSLLSVATTPLLLWYLVAA